MSARPTEVRELVDSLKELVVLLRANQPTPRTSEAPPERPSRKLKSWKEILEVSREHEGPTSLSWLRQLCKERNAPVFVWKGMAAVADEARFVWWLEGLRVPIGLSSPGESRDEGSSGQAARAKRLAHVRSKRSGRSAKKGT